jgi:kinesin family protein 18/19
LTWLISVALQATGCGKTHTISGSPTQPGVVFLIMKDLFSRIQAKSHDTDFSLTVSYLEIYNETIRDLLHPESGPLALREINGVAAPAGLSTKEPSSANDVVEWIMLGNSNRTVNATEANATSSRSHAVLSVTVSQKPRAGGLTENHSSASLSIIDLAGSERASVTKNKGDRLIEGANINRSLLALGNCINALCDPRKRGHVPYRDSKLTRLLKQSLGGNCKTVMIVCVSPSSQHYDETHNTLQYANRAKEIKTKAIRNVVTVDRHVQDYCRAIAKLQQQVAEGEALYESRSASSRAATIEAERIEVEGAVRKVKGPWDNMYSLSVRSERAKVEKEGIEGVILILQRWRRTAFQNLDLTSSDPTLYSTQSACDALIASLTSSARSCNAESPASSINMFKVIRTSTASTLPSSALATFNLEVRILELQLESARVRSREEGLLEGSKVQARAMSAMCEARARVAGAIESRRAHDVEVEVETLVGQLAEGIDSANREAFLAFSTGSHLAIVASNKRDLGARSPTLLDSYSLPKSSRAAISGAGSSATGALASPKKQPAATTTSFTRRSPRKNVLFQPRTNPILRNSPKKKKGLGVQWRDETGDGFDLEDVRRASISPASTLSNTSVEESSSALSTPTYQFNPANPFASTSSHMPTASTSTAAEMIAATKRSAMAPLGRAQRSAPPPVSTDTPFTFLRDDSVNSMPPPPLRHASRAPALLENSTPSGFVPLVAARLAPNSPPVTRRSGASALAQQSSAARRSSAMGPLRTTKVNRRNSFVPVDLGMTPMGKRSLRGAGSIASAPASVPTSRKVSSRTSIPPGSSTAPGSKSEARLVARRESALSAIVGNSSIARESIGGGKWR